MKSRTEKEDILYILLLFTIVVFAMPVVNAQSSGACCVETNGLCTFDEDTTAATCSGEFNSTHSCNNIPACVQVCCKLVDSCEPQTSAQCAVAGGENNGLPLDKCNQNFCNSNVVLLRGTVKYFDAILAGGADVKVFNPSGAEIASVKAGDNGVFVIPVSKSSVYSVTITAPLNSACSRTMQVSVGESDYNIEDLSLPCKSHASGCMTTWVTGSWSDPRNCGFRTVTKSPTDNCGVLTLENKPADFMPCGESSCGNNVLEPDEYCDIVNGAASFDSDKDSCSDFGSNMQGIVTCSNQCQIISDCISCSGACNDQRMCEYCPTQCAGQPLCENGCSSGQQIDEFMAEGTYVNGLKGINLEWKIPDTCTASTIKIFRCEGNNDNTPTACSSESTLTFLNSVSGGESAYVDTSFAQTIKSLCYNISTTINNGFESVTIYSSHLACAPVWDDECINNPNEPMCVGKNLVVCQNGKLQTSLSKTCDCGCRGKTASFQAACVGTINDCDACDICSGPYGLFPYKDYALSEIYNNVYSSCIDDMRSQPGEEKMCYLDDYSRNKAVIGQYHACADVSSCYNYRTKSSCESNPCGIIAVDEGNCKWTSLTENNELGLGVCVPSNQEEQDCTNCNGNGILGNYCSEELCLLYGSDSSGKTTCHFNNVQRYPSLGIDNSSCMNIEDVACETYDSETECIGAEKTNFTADIIYDLASSSIVGGSNKYVQSSRDLYNKGKCIWAVEGEVGKCIKDSDMSSKIGDYRFDCRTDSCLKDFTNPQTKLFALDNEITNGGSYSLEELKILTVQVSEPIPQANTFISASKSGPVYPQNSYATNKNAFVNRITELGEGEITLYFYSMDSSKNREEIKSVKINLIPSLQGRVGVDTELTSSFYESSDTFLTDLVVSINHEENLKCDSDLRNVLNSGTEISGGTLKSGTEIDWNYKYLSDGSYQLKVNCVDDHLQTFVYNEELLIDADMSMHNVYPRGETFKSGNIEIGLSTNESAVCYYTTNKDVSNSTLEHAGQSGSPWTKFSITEGTEHSANVNIQSNGLNFFYPACYFENTNKWFTFRMGDVIYFAVDGLSPEIKIYDQETGAIYEYINSTLTDFVSLRITCEDNSSVLNSGTKSYAFGCGSDSITVTKYYQEYGQNGLTMNVDSIKIDSGEIVDISAPGNYVNVYLNITAVDRGGNSRNVVQQINVRNLSFLEPTVTICDMILGVCT